MRYASFGLVWREFGARVCDGDADVAARVDQSLVQGVDANDTGQAVVAPIVEGVRPMTVSGVIGGLNRRWDEDLTAEDERARFDAAVELARGIVEREIASAAAGQRAVRIVEAAVGRARDPRVIELERDVPWKEVVVTQAPDALFVVYPKRQGWGLEAVPRELGSFTNRRDLPEAWAGLDGPDLARLTGVQDALFAHAKRFLAVARSREGIAALAEQALAEYWVGLGLGSGVGGALCGRGRLTRRLGTDAPRGKGSDRPGMAPRAHNDVPSPPRRAGRPLERADDVGRDPAAVEAALLRPTRSSSTQASSMRPG